MNKKEWIFYIAKPGNGCGSGVYGSKDYVLKQIATGQIRGTLYE